jgi:hypothetical protein
MDRDIIMKMILQGKDPSMLTSFLNSGGSMTDPFPTYTTQGKK